MAAPGRGEARRAGVLPAECPKRVYCRLCRGEILWGPGAHRLEVSLELCRGCPPDRVGRRACLEGITAGLAAPIGAMCEAPADYPLGSVERRLYRWGWWAAVLTSRIDPAPAPVTPGELDTEHDH